MTRFLAIFLAAMATSPAGSADPLAWTCKPAWNFSSMGNKSYEGSSVNEAAAKDLARANCVNDNRGLELDDFCLADPKSNDWRCLHGEGQAAGASPKD